MVKKVSPHIATTSSCYNNCIHSFKLKLANLFSLYVQKPFDLFCILYLQYSVYTLSVYIHTSGHSELRECLLPCREHLQWIKKIKRTSPSKANIDHGHISLLNRTFSLFKKCAIEHLCCINIRKNSEGGVFANERELSSK